MRATFQTATVPGTTVTITIDVQPADRHLAEVLNRPGLAKTHWYVTRNTGTGSPYVNYLSCGRDSEAEARAEANFLWSDTVTRRDAYAASR